MTRYRPDWDRGDVVRYSTVASDERFAVLGTGPIEDTFLIAPFEADGLGDSLWVSFEFADAAMEKVVR